MGRYDNYKPRPMSREDTAEFITRFEPPYTADKFAKFYLSKTPRLFRVPIKFYLILFLAIGLLSLVIIGIAQVPLLIVIIGIFVYLIRKQRISKLKKTKNK